MKDAIELEMAHGYYLIKLILKLMGADRSRLGTAKGGMMCWSGIGYCFHQVGYFPLTRNLR